MPGGGGGAARAPPGESIVDQFLVPPPRGGGREQALGALEQRMTPSWPRIPRNVPRLCSIYRLSLPLEQSCRRYLDSSGMGLLRPAREIGNAN